MSKSPVSFFRGQLKFKGKSVYSGRDFYDFLISDDVCVEQILAKVTELAEVWAKQGIVESYTDTVDKIVIVIKKDKFPSIVYGFAACYRKLVVNKKEGWISIYQV